MNNTKFYTELEATRAFVAYGKVLQARFNLEENPACIGNWLIRDQYNRPFCSGPFLWIRSASPEELRDKYDSPLIKPLNALSFEEFVVITTKFFALRDAVIDEGEAYLKQTTPGPVWQTEWAEPIKKGKFNFILTGAQNDDFERQGYASYRQGFREKFKTEWGTFTVEYGTLKANQRPYFSTTYSGIDWGGQAQEKLKRHDPKLYAFFRKWDRFHCSALALDEMQELQAELATLRKLVYSYKFRGQKVYYY